MSRRPVQSLISPYVTKTPVTRIACRPGGSHTGLQSAFKQVRLKGVQVKMDTGGLKRGSEDVVEVDGPDDPDRSHSRSHNHHHRRPPSLHGVSIWLALAAAGKGPDSWRPSPGQRTETMT